MGSKDFSTQLMHNFSILSIGKGANNYYEMLRRASDVISDEIFR